MIKACVGQTQQIKAHVEPSSNIGLYEVISPKRPVCSKQGKAAILCI